MDLSLIPIYNLIYHHNNTDKNIENSKGSIINNIPTVFSQLLLF